MKYVLFHQCSRQVKRLTDRQTSTGSEASNPGTRRSRRFSSNNPELSVT